MADKQVLEKKDKNKKLEQYSQYCKSLVVKEDDENDDNESSIKHLLGPAAQSSQYLRSSYSLSPTKQTESSPMKKPFQIIVEQQERRNHRGTV